MFLPLPSIRKQLRPITPIRIVRFRKPDAELVEGERKNIRAMALGIHPALYDRRRASVSGGNIFSRRAIPNSELFKNREAFCSIRPGM